jgi:hypothetical protein
MPFVGFVVGAVICSLPYLLYLAQFPPPAVTAIALALASAGLAIIRPADKWQSGIAVGASIVVPMVVSIAPDLLRDPTSHNLWPLGLLFGLAVTMPAALLGAWLGGYLGRTAALPTLAGAAITAAGIFLAAAHVPFVLAERDARELRAQEKLNALVAAQSNFRSSNRRAVYTCNLRKLGEAFDTPIRAHESVRPVEGIYTVGTWARAGDYEFMLLCEDMNRGRRFLLTAAPTPGTLGRWAYCVGTDGVLRQVERSRYSKRGCARTGP